MQIVKGGNLNKEQDRTKPITIRYGDTPPAIQAGVPLTRSPVLVPGLGRYFQILRIELKKIKLRYLLRVRWYLLKRSVRKLLQKDQK